jgi:rRNA maturation protein Nop10
MEHQKCRLCGARHALSAPHVFSLVDFPPPPEEDIAPPLKAGLVETEALPAQPAKFDRVAYQREYMRKRRKAAKTRES